MARGVICHPQSSILFRCAPFVVIAKIKSSGILFA
jgi:hypothetical protein